jgi:hypothetical protein
MRQNGCFSPVKYRIPKTEYLPTGLMNHTGFSGTGSGKPTTGGSQPGGWANQPEGNPAE